MSTLSRTLSNVGSGRVLVMFESVAPGRTFDGIRERATIEWGRTGHRMLSHDEASDNSMLCRAIGLDPDRFVFDLPQSARGIGSAQAGAGGSTRGAREISGFGFKRGANGKPDGDPIVKVRFITEGSAMRDFDPTDRREWERL